MRAGPGPGLANACGQPRGTYIMLPGPPQAIRPGGLDRGPPRAPALERLLARAWTRPARVVAYGLGMPASKRPAPQDAVTATQNLLDGLARDAGIFGDCERAGALASPQQHLPGEVFLRLGAGALDWCGASRADPVSLERIRERFLPECAFGGRGEPQVPVRCASSGGAARGRRA